MDYHCNCCGYDFFMEEGYNADFDAIFCPVCGRYVEQERCKANGKNNSDD